MFGGINNDETENTIYQNYMNKWVYDTYVDLEGSITRILLENKSPSVSSDNCNELTECDKSDNKNQ